jgi:hypothetical protein
VKDVKEGKKTVSFDSTKSAPDDQMTADFSEKTDAGTNNDVDNVARKFDALSTT